MNKTNLTPTVLIISNGFQAGDAITTLNLFSKFPKEKIYCTSLVASRYIKNLADFYHIGDKEIKYSFPYKYIFKPKKSETGTDLFSEKVKTNNDSLLKKIYKKIIRPSIQWLDLYDSRYKLLLSNELYNWINKINPDIIYTSIGDVNMAKFLIQINQKFPNIKLVIHNYDYWIQPSYKLWNNRFHQEKAQKLFKELLTRATVLFTSSEKMAQDYYKSYNLNFNFFPNPVKLVKQLHEVEKNKIPNVIFIGKIAWHNNAAIRDMIDAVHILNKENNDIIFDIYTDTPISEIMNFVGRIQNSTKIHKGVPNDEIPNILSSSHILFLPINHDKQTQKFTKYSMSTKMGEYLSSRTPTIYYGPSNIAMTDFLLEHLCTKILTTRDIRKLANLVLECLNQDTKIMTSKAFTISDKYFNIENISQKFFEKLCSL